MINIVEKNSFFELPRNFAWLYDELKVTYVKVWQGGVGEGNGGKKGLMWYFQQQRFILKSDIYK